MSLATKLGAAIDMLIETRLELATAYDTGNATMIRSSRENAEEARGELWRLLDKLEQRIGPARGPVDPSTQDHESEPPF